MEFSYKGFNCAIDKLGPNKYGVYYDEMTTGKKPIRFLISASNMKVVEDEVKRRIDVKEAKEEAGDDCVRYPDGWLCFVKSVGKYGIGDTKTEAMEHARRTSLTAAQQSKIDDIISGGEGGFITDEEGSATRYICKRYDNVLARNPSLINELNSLADDEEGWRDVSSSRGIHAFIDKWFREHM